VTTTPVPRSDSLLVTRADLDSWLATAPDLDWTWAKTYADTAPHSYVVHPHKQLDREDFRRASRVIRAFGEPGRFYTNTNIYLADHPSGKKWWSMDRHPDDGDLINQADLALVYGPQDAPATALRPPVTATPPPPSADRFTAIAPNYDATRPSADTSAGQTLRSIVVRHFGAYAPTTLDVGCGTGRLLDLGITAPGVYIGVDASQGMLNELVLKHPRLTAPSVIAADANALPWQYTPQPDLVVALFGSADYLAPQTIRELAKHARSMAIFMHDADHRPVASTTATARGLLAHHRGYQLKLANYETVVIEK